MRPEQEALARELWRRSEKRRMAQDINVHTGSQPGSDEAMDEAKARAILADDSSSEEDKKKARDCLAKA